MIILHAPLTTTMDISATLPFATIWDYKKISLWVDAAEVLSEPLKELVKSWEVENRMRFDLNDV